MDISLKYKIIERIIQSNDDHILRQINNLLDSSQKEDNWMSLPEPVQKAIRQAEKELEEGKGIPHKEVMKEINARF